MAKEKESKEKKIKKEKVKKDKKPKAKKEEKFLNSLKKELQQVKWPTAKEMVKYTITTIIFCIILIAFFSFLTFIVASIKELVG